MSTRRRSYAKIVATLRPASSSEAMIRAPFLAGGGPELAYRFELFPPAHPK